MSDGKLVFETEIDTKGFEKGLKNLQEQAKALSGVTVDIEADTKQTEKAVSKVKQQLNTLSNSPAEIEITADTSGVSQAVNSIRKEIENSTAGLKIAHTSATIDGLTDNLKKSALQGKKLGTEIDNGSKQAEQSVSQLTSSVGSLGGTFDSLLKGVMAGFTGRELVDYFISSNAQMEQYTKSFATMLKDTEKAKALMKDLEQFAAKTPLQLTDVTKSAQMLLNYGASADDVIYKLRQLGDLSLGNAEKLNRIALAYGQMLAKGKVTGEELRQMTEAGVPMLQALADSMGVTTAKISKMVETGKVGIPQLEKAIASLTSGSGQFAGAMEEQASTMTGILSTLKDNFSKFGREAGEKAFERIKESLQEVMTAIENASANGVLENVAEELGDSLNVLVNAIIRVSKFLWEYRDAVKAGAAAMVAFNALLKITNLLRDLYIVYQVLTGALNKATAAQLANNAAMVANPIGLVISAIGALITALVVLGNALSDTDRKLNKMLSNYSKIKSEIDEINQQLNDNKKKISEIQALGKLSPANQQEIEKLQSMNEELELQLALKKSLADSAAKDVDQTAATNIFQIGDDITTAINGYNTAKKNLEDAKTEYNNLSSETNDEREIELALKDIEWCNNALEIAKTELLDNMNKVKGWRNNLLEQTKDSIDAAEKADGLLADAYEALGESLNSNSSSSRIYGSSILDGINLQAQGIEQSLKTQLEKELQMLEDQRTLALIEDDQYYAKAKELLESHNENLYGEYKSLWGNINRYYKSCNEKALSEQKAVNEKLTAEQKKAAQEMANEWKSGFDEVIKEQESAMNSLQDEAESFAEKLADYGDLFTEEDGNLFINDISDQIEQLKAYQKAIDDLKEAGASEEFLAEFRGLDIDSALAYSESILGGDFDAYMQDWEEKQRLSQEIAGEVYQEQFETLQNDFTEKITDELSRMPAVAEQLGKDTAEKFIDGVMDSIPKMEEWCAKMQAAVDQNHAEFAARFSSAVISPQAYAPSASTAAETVRQTTINLPITLDGKIIATKVIEIIGDKIYLDGKEVF